MNYIPKGRIWEYPTEYPTEYLQWNTMSIFIFSFDVLCIGQEIGDIRLSSLINEYFIPNYKYSFRKSDPNCCFLSY
jgi:hypothetical protein